MRQITDRFNAAVRRCVGPEPVKQRLVEAWTHELEAIGASELPRQLRSEFRVLRKAMNTAQPQPHESAARASVRKMSARQAGRHTQRILQLSQDLQRISSQADSTASHKHTEQITLPQTGTLDRLN